MQQRQAIRYGLLALLLAFLCLGLGQRPAQAQLSVRGQKTFVKGINLPWLSFSRTFGVQPEYGGGPNYSSANMDTYFGELQNLNAKVVRLFLFEGHDGLTFDANGHVSGLQSAFLSNLDDTFQKANNHGLALYVTLLYGSVYSANDIHYHLYGGTVNDNGAVPQSGAPANTVVANFFTDSGAQSDFVSNAAAQIASRYGSNPALFAIDLINESDIAIGSGVYTRAQLRTFIQNAATAIHNVNSSIQVTCSTNNLADLQDGTLAGTYGGLGLDFYDVHIYNTNISLPTVGQGTFHPDRPVVLGETGPTFYGGKSDQYNDALQASEFDAAITQAMTRGWAGVLPWSYLDDGNGNGIRKSDGTLRPSGTTIQNDYASAGSVRFFPRPGFAYRMTGGKFQGSSDNSSWTDLYTVSGSPPEGAWISAPLSVDPKQYRYLRYLAPNGGYGNVSEIEFYSGSAKLVGTGFGTAGSWQNDGNTFAKALDGDTSTFFDAPGPDGDYVGIDTGAAGPPDTAQYNFESGLQGWSSISSNCAVVTSALQAFAGSKSLAVAINTSGAGTAYTRVLNTGSSTPMPGAGQTVTFHVWVPGGSPVSGVTADVQDANWNWTGGYIGGSTLTPGQWNTVQVTVPSNAVTPLNAIGVSFTTSAAWSGTCYLDSISW